jgi:hypothetical protein
MTWGKKVALGFLGTAYVALVVSLVATLVSSRWEGCNELPTTAGEKVALLTLTAGIIALILAVLVALGLWNTSRLEVLLVLAVAMASTAAVVGVVAVMKQHPTSGGCG